MSQLLQALTQEVSGGNLGMLSQMLGAPQGQTQSAVGAALPMLVGALTRNAQQPGGAQSLANALDKNHSQPLQNHASALGGFGPLLNMAMGSLGGQQQAPKALDGAGILGHLFGGGQQQAAAKVAESSGVSMAQAMQILVALAPLVMSTLGTMKQEKNLDAGGLAGMLQQEHGPGPGGGILSGLVDPKGDGIGMDDMMRMGTAVANSGILGSLFGGK